VSVLSSLSSLASLGKVKDKKGRDQIAKLAVDNITLQQQLGELTARNERGR